MKKRPSGRKDSPHVVNLIRLRRQPSGSARKLLMEAIWKARRQDRLGELEFRIKDVVLHPGKKGATARVRAPFPGTASENLLPTFGESQGSPRAQE
eukprot:1511835-Alexandrium_andersonii.AAC.1